MQFYFVIKFLPKMDQISEVNISRTTWKFFKNFFHASTIIVLHKITENEQNLKISLPDIP